MSEQKIKDLELLKAFPSRQILESELRECIKEVQKEINEERPIVIEYTYESLLKRELKVLNYLVDLPDTIINDLRFWIIEERDE